MSPDGVFCRIIAGKQPARVVHNGAGCLAFVTLRPIGEGAFMVMPKTHIDRFTDLPDDRAAHVLTVVQHYGRTLVSPTPAKRVGRVVHGFGVPHALLNVVPQNDTMDILPVRFIRSDGPVTITEAAIPIPTRADLDAFANGLRTPGP